MSEYIMIIVKKDGEIVYGCKPMTIKSEWNDAQVLEEFNKRIKEKQPVFEAIISLCNVENELDPETCVKLAKIIS